MSDSVERAAEIDAPLQQLKQKIDAEPAARSGGFAAGLSLLLVLALGCGVGAAGYWLWPQWQSLQAHTKAMQQDQQRLTEQNTLLQDYQRQQQQQLRQRLAAQQPAVNHGKLLGKHQSTEQHQG